MPMSRVDSVNTLMNTAVIPPTAGPPQLLSNLATLERREVPAVLSHSNVQPVFDVYANRQDRDLGSVAAAVQQIAADLRPKPRRRRGGKMRKTLAGKVALVTGYSYIGRRSISRSQPLPTR